MITQRSSTSFRTIEEPKNMQTNLFISLAEQLKQPLIVAYGAGVDSTAVLVELHRRGVRPDAILFADTGDEKAETYAYLPIINRWLKSVNFPQVTTVRYVPKKTGKGPLYTTLGQNCLSNGTLPSLAFGFKSCSLKWKVVPQNKWTENWLPARDCWRAGGKVLKIIGYDTSPNDLKRYAHAKGVEDPSYQYWYPLIEWGMDRDACKQAILRAGLPVPPKSACKFCPATQPEELRAHRKEYLRYIVIMEARAKPKLQGCMTADQLKADYDRRLHRWNRRMAAATPAKRQQLQEKRPRLKALGKGCAGLWRSSTQSRPATMTEYILQERLLSAQEVFRLQQHGVTEIEQMQSLKDQGEDIINWHDFLEMFSAEDALHEGTYDCSGCGAVSLH